MIVTIHRGTREIGGSCVELTAGGSRLIIDAGLPLDESRRDELPKVPGLFSSGSRIDAILLSHSHGDHCGLAAQTLPEIPLYMSRGTRTSLMAGAIYGRGDRLQKSRAQIFRKEEPFRIGAFRITAMAVDHSAFDACAFLIEADGRRILYTGDLRLHGRKPWMAQNLTRAARRRGGLDALIMEGTHFSGDRQRGFTEEELQIQIEADLAATRGLALAAFSPLNADRLVTFYKAARSVGRIFVLDVYGAFVLKGLSRQISVPAPVRRARFRVYYNEGRRKHRLEKQFASAEIQMDEILAHPSRYLMLFRPGMMSRDFQNPLPSGTRCIYSYWSGYTRQPEWEACQRELQRQGAELIHRHSSGHIYADDIVAWVSKLAPRRIIPIHTTNPEAFLRHFPQTTLPKDGDPFQIDIRKDQMRRSSE